MTYHPIVHKIIELLDHHDMHYQCFEHEAVRTSEEAAVLRPEYTLAQGAKALIVSIKKKGVSKEQEKQFVQIVVPGDSKFNTKKARQTLNAKDIRFALPEEVESITNGVQPGGVPPFGNLFGIAVYVDSTLLLNEKIIFNAGDRKFSIALKSKDYIQVVQPNIVEVV